MIKKILLTILLIGSGLSVWASHSKHYGMGTAVSTGNGLVYVSDSETPPAANATGWSMSSSRSFNCGEDEGKDQQTLYFHAKASDGYHFVGWSSQQTTPPSFPSSYLGTDNMFAGRVSAESTSDGSPTETIYYAYFERNPPVVYTCLPSSCGSYQVTCAGSTTTVSSTGVAQEIATTMNLNLTASPPSGQKVLGWYTCDAAGENKIYFSTAQKVDGFVRTFNTMIGVDYISSETPVFILKGIPDTPYTDLGAALAAANASSNSKVVVLVSDGVVGAGTYTIPSGVTLLVPRDDAHTVVEDVPPADATRTAPSAYRTLTLGAGAVVNVHGKVSLAAKLISVNTSSKRGNVGIQGPYGRLEMGTGSTMNLQTGAKLFAWGFVTGPGVVDSTVESGVIHARSGSTVYEAFRFTDFKGGSCTLAMTTAAKTKRDFPISQYYVQSIESPLVVHSGATEKLGAWINANSSDNHADVKLFAANASDSMFGITAGSVTKRYDGVNDRLLVDIDENASVSLGIVKLQAGSISFDSSNFILPLMDNITVNLKNGSSLAITKDTKFQAGSRVNIEPGATLTVNSGVKLYLYDDDEWGNFCWGDGGSWVRNIPLQPAYLANKNAVRATTGPFGDACICVDGTLEVKGALYASAGGAQVCGSRNGGQVKFTAAPPTGNSTLYDISTFSSMNVTYAETSCAAAPLQNADLTKVTTAGLPANTTYAYVNGVWMQPLPPIRVGVMLDGVRKEFEVSGAYLAELGLSSPDVAAAEAALAAVQANGLAKWQNDLLGVDGTVAANRPQAVFEQVSTDGTVHVKWPVALGTPKFTVEGIRTSYELEWRDGMVEGSAWSRYGESQTTPDFVLAFGDVEGRKLFRIVIKIVSGE